MTTPHPHIYRAVPGAGWRCIACGRWTVARPPKEQTAAWQQRQHVALLRAMRDFYQDELVAVERRLAALDAEPRGQQ